MKKRIIAMVMVAVFMLTGLSFAQEVARKGYGAGQGKGRKQSRRMGKKRNMKMMIMNSFFLNPRMIEELELTDEQVSKLEKMKVAHMKKMIDMRADKQKMMIDLKMMMKETDLNVAGIESQLQKVANRKVQMQVSKLKAYQEAKSVLTAAQKTKVDDFCSGKYFRKNRKSMRSNKMKMNKSKGKVSSEDPSNWLGFFDEEAAQADNEEVQEVEIKE